MPSIIRAKTSLEDRVERAQSGEPQAAEELLEQFRPLIKSRVYALWGAVNEDLSNMEWADVEAEVTWQFLARVQSFRPDDGVYFSHYIERMLYFDGLSWIRQQRRSAAVPFSQLMPQSEADSSQPEDWFLSEEYFAEDDLEQTVSLKEALAHLPEQLHQVVWQCCVLGHTEVEAANYLDLSRSTVRNRLETALSQLRAHFELDEKESTRTGRAGKPGSAHYEFWSYIMAKDEKRPDLVGIGAGRPVLLQGTYDFPATGLKTPKLLSPKLRYVVPVGSIAGIRFIRVGNVCDKMICVSSVVNGLPHRLIPVAANSSMHVPLAIVEAIPAGSEIEIHIASEAAGMAIIDVGCLQMPA
ncbi:sigma-70 family RNA polymerase sigma factor [bacterium]|nr:MAG: sigma-70 family RNA polymerase sigma factor [bacterium]